MARSTIAEVFFTKHLPSNACVHKKTDIGVQQTSNLRVEVADEVCITQTSSAKHRNHHPLYQVGATYRQRRRKAAEMSALAEE